ncbi:hypothetical protein [Streptomyces sp. enrichment culture]|uniref:hypothetical protein n=1 Tax=Streptomyces sp. enrichment culture TaxID=1795815 RepID=UPI003F55E6DF
MRLGPWCAPLHLLVAVIAWSRVHPAARTWPQVRAGAVPGAALTAGLLLTA